MKIILKIALNSLINMINKYDKYGNGTLMNFYNTLCKTLDIKLSGFRKASKDFTKTLYIKIW